MSLFWHCVSTIFLEQVGYLVMAVLWNRAGHYIFVMRFLSFFFVSFSGMCFLLLTICFFYLMGEGTSK